MIDAYWDAAGHFEGFQWGLGLWRQLPTKIKGGRTGACMIRSIVILDVFTGGRQTRDRYL